MEYYMRGLFGRILTLVLIALIIYNFIQISSLRKEVASLESEVASLKASADKDESSSSMLDEARLHLDNAKDLALKGSYDKARIELQKGVACLEKAGRDAGSKPVNAAKSLQNKLRNTANNIDMFIKKYDHSKPRNGGK
jgi:hypothetical protein